MHASRRGTSLTGCSHHCFILRSAPMKDTRSTPSGKKIGILPNLIFMSRWLQLPLYLGLILAQCVYVYHFWVELSDLIGAAMGNAASLEHILDAVAIEGALRPDKLNEQTIMLVVLA